MPHLFDSSSFTKQTILNQITSFHLGYCAEVEIEGDQIPKNASNRKDAIQIVLNQSWKILNRKFKKRQMFEFNNSDELNWVDL